MNDRIFVYYGSLHLIYKRKYSKWFNEYDEGREWEITEDWSFIIGRKLDDEKFFELLDIYYDGHTVRGFVFCGLKIALSYSYDSKRINDECTKLA